MDKDFLLAVFRETHYHIRATERKYLIITGAYLGFLTVLLSVIRGDFLANTTNSSQVVRLSTFSFFLFVGLIVHMKQKWYRAWKDHYLETSYNLGQRFLGAASPEDLTTMPYWLRQKTPKGGFSIDNILNYFTIIINSVLLLVIAVQGSALVVSHALGTLVEILLVTAYIGFMYYVEKMTTRSPALFA